MSGFYRFIRFLSLDIVLGVAASSVLACKVLELHTSLSYNILLPLVVWVLYLTDHLLDGFRHSTTIAVSRYTIYYTKRKPLFVLLIILVLISVCILWYSFDWLTIYFGMIVGLVVVVYFVFQELSFKGKIKIFPKEPVIAIVYTLGIWGLPLIMYKWNFTFALYLALIAFELLVLVNVHICSILQHKEDIKSGYSSLAGAFGLDFVFKLNTVILLMTAILCVSIILSSPSKVLRDAGEILLLMDGWLFLVNVFSRKSDQKELFAGLNDAVFFLPLTILLLQG